MVNPVNMQLAHWNLEHAAQQLRDPAAAAAQAGLQGESAAAAVHRDGSVQPADQGAEGERIGVRKKKDRQHQEGRRKRAVLRAEYGGKTRGRRLTRGRGA